MAHEIGAAESGSFGTGFLDTGVSHGTTHVQHVDEERIECGIGRLGHTQCDVQRGFNTTHLKIDGWD
jgi:hypothetical protein